jgi:hypothetical protein
MVQPALPPADLLPVSRKAASFQRVKELMPAYHDQPERKLLRPQLTNLF